MTCKINWEVGKEFHAFLTPILKGDECWHITRFMLRTGRRVGGPFCPHIHSNKERKKNFTPVVQPIT
jgi:hypothetical protein